MKTLGNDSVKEEIITASQAVFQRYGYTRVSMQDISKECKKGRSTLYHYFNNKEEVLNAVCYKIFSKCLRESEEAITKRKSFSANIEAFNAAKLKHLREMVHQYKLAIDDLRQDPSSFLIKLRAFAEDEINVVKKIITWGVENKDIVALQDEDIQFLAETLNAAFKSFEQEIIIFGRFPNYENKVAWLAQMFHKGLL
jgi:AcrR family transcriptional regulator